MLILAKFIGVAILVLGVTILFLPQFMKQMLRFWSEGKHVYAGGAIRIVIGVILLFAASKARLTGAAAALGVLFIAGGTFVFMMGLEKIKQLLGWWLEVPEPVYRVMGVVAASFGALILYVC